MTQTDPRQPPARVPGPVDAAASAWCQRWRGRRHSWRHVADGGFDARRFDVVRVAEADAKRFVVDHHYSASMPAARFCYGLFTDAGPAADAAAVGGAVRGLVGVAVLSVPMRELVTRRVFSGLEPYVEALELGRFVLADHVPGNAESWFLARVFAAAAGEGIRGVVSFADPVPRSVGGRLVMPGHVGTIYQASNAVYCGRATPRTVRVFADGTIFSDRAAAKVRSGERGRAYAVGLLVDRGARPPAPGEDWRAWLADALASTTVTHRHGGNHRYAFPVGRTRAERARVLVAPGAGAYPKRVDEPMIL